MKRALAVLTLALLAACSSDGAPQRADPPASSPAPQETEEDRGGAPRTFRAARVDLELEPLARGFDAPLLVTNAEDGSNRLFVGEQGGFVWTLEEGSKSARPLLDISDRIVAGGEQGLLGLAFHPEFEDNGRFFVNYTDVNGDTVIAEYKSSGERADPDSARTLVQIDQPFANHNGGALAFGPDGYLYIATGDGGGAGDPDGNGQRLDTLLGKILRLDVDGRDAGLPYAIPSDNPFVDRDDARPEIWAYGLRNPWRFSFDSETIWIADVGQSELEEINAVPAGRAGLNFGWDVMEATACFESEDCDRSNKVLPVSEYGHDQGCSVTGGLVYRGDRFPDMVGGYFFGDYCSGLTWALAAERPRSQPQVEVLQSGRSISSFGAGEDGEIYLTDLTSGEVLHLVDRSVR